MFFKSNINHWNIYLYLYTAIYFILLSSIRIWLLVFSNSGRNNFKIFFHDQFYTTIQRGQTKFNIWFDVVIVFCFIYVNFMFVFACFICVYLTVTIVQSIFTFCSYLVFIYHFWFLKLFNDYYHLWILLM